jgi:hypothetical protein
LTAIFKRRAGSSKIFAVPIMLTLRTSVLKLSYHILHRCNYGIQVKIIVGSGAVMDAIGIKFPKSKDI